MRSRKPSMCVALCLIGLASTVWAQEATPPVKPAAAPSVTEAKPPRIRQVNLVAEKWKWTPNTITVTQGSMVRLEVESDDASRIFELKDYGLSVPIPQGERTRIEFMADKVGRFPFRCARFCGNGCSKLRGTLIVEPAP